LGTVHSRVGEEIPCANGIGAGMVADAPAAGKLVEEIKTALDALSRGQGIQ
jgi:hypothetical protein